MKISKQKSGTEIFNQSLINDNPYCIVNNCLQFCSGLHNGGQIKWVNNLDDAKIFQRREVFENVRISISEFVEKMYI